MALSQNIKRFRKAKGISQECMGELLHMDQSVYCRLENNETACAERLPKIAQALDTTAEVLRTYHLTDDSSPAPALADAEPSAETLLIEKDMLIQQQTEEITFLRRQITYLQAVWHQYCGGSTLAVRRNEPTVDRNVATCADR